MKFSARDIIDITYDLEHTLCGQPSQGSVKLLGLLRAAVDEVAELKPDTIELWIGFGYVMGKQNTDVQPEPGNPFSRRTRHTIEPRGNML